MDFLVAISPKKSIQIIKIAIIAQYLTILGITFYIMACVSILFSIIVVVILGSVLAPLQSILFSNLRQLNIQNESYRRAYRNKNKVFAYVGFQWIELDINHDRSIINNFKRSGGVIENGGPTAASILVRSRKKKLSNIK